MGGSTLLAVEAHSDLMNPWRRRGKWFWGILSGVGQRTGGWGCSEQQVGKGPAGAYWVGTA